MNREEARGRGSDTGKFGLLIVVILFRRQRVRRYARALSRLMSLAKYRKPEDPRGGVGQTCAVAVFRRAGREWGGSGYVSVRTADKARVY